MATVLSEAACSRDIAPPLRQDLNLASSLPMSSTHKVHKNAIFRLSPLSLCICFFTKK
jgi:hypothetical protein